MTVVLVAALMWLLVVSLLVLRRGRAERNITYAAVAIAVAMTLNVDRIYRALDARAGGTNVVTLFADVALIVGIFFLGRGVMKASEHQPSAVRFALGRVALTFAVAGAVGSFVLIDRGGTTTRFMLDFGDQPAAAAYSMIQFAYFGVVLLAMASLAAQQLPRSSGAQLLPPAALLVGSICGVLLSLVVIIMDVAHVVGNLAVMATVAAAYEPLRLSTFLLLCLGFASQPAARTFQSRSRERTTRLLVTELHPIWTHATTARPGIRQDQQISFRVDEPEALLHRQVVEIRDALIDGRVSFEVTDGERALVEKAEHHLLGQESRDAVSITASLRTRESRKP